MNNFEETMLRERENRLIAAGVLFTVTSPLFGGIAGLLFDSSLAFYSATVLVAGFAVLGIIGTLKERRARNRAV